MFRSFDPDNLGNRTAVTFGNGAAQAFGYDPVARLTSLTNTLTDTNDLSATFTYNPASQIASTVRTGDMYAWTGTGNGSTAFTQNGLNQQVTVGGATATWDANGNLTTEPQSGKGYGYSSENLLTSSSGGTAATLSYDPALRLYQVAGAATTRFLYDGADAIAEYNSSNALQRRFVFDPTSGQPVLWYEGTGTAATNRRYLSQDERGSVISVSGSTGTSLGLNTYDEYGKPGAANLGRYQYTGQMWLPETNAYHFPNRDLLAQLGIFAQTDPIGIDGGMNLYAYVGDDPVNLVDPLGLVEISPIYVNGPHCNTGVLVLPDNSDGSSFGWFCADSSGQPPSQLGDPTQFEFGGIGGFVGNLKKAAKSLYCAIAPHPSVTLQASATGSYATGLGAASFGYTAAMDSSGSIELFETTGGYRGFGAGADFALSAGASTAKTVGDLVGPFLTGSITSSEAGGVTANGFTGRSANGRVVGGEVGLSFGAEESGMFGVNNSRPIGGISC